MVLGRQLLERIAAELLVADIAPAELLGADIVAEVERYMAIPGQALSYKVGQLTILKLRADAEKQLGDKFDIKDFHDQILATGSLPMAAMERKGSDWVDAELAKH